MKKKGTLVSIFFLLLFSIEYAQTPTNKGSNPGGTTVNKNENFQVKWKTDPFDHQVFIENKGQFDRILPGNEKVLYGVQLGHVWAYFTLHGIIYCYSERPKRAENSKDKDPDEDDTTKPVLHYMISNWEGSNPSVTIIAAKEKSDYYTYSGIAVGTTIKTNIFKEITYRNIYPGIDIEYTFPVGKEGFEYSLVVHSGGDISKAIMKYETAGKLRLNNMGDVIFNSPMGTFTEHAPLANYSGETGSIDVSYQLIGNTESFRTNRNYDKSKTLVIDPWITDPLFATRDRAYDLSWDYFGNVYAYGNDVNNLQFVKMNKLGVIQWTYNAIPMSGGTYGAFTTDKVTGTSYLCKGYGNPSEVVLKVNSSGILVGTFSGGGGDLNELWRARFDPCNRDIVIGCGSTTGLNQAGVLDTNMTSINPVNVLGASLVTHDMTLIAIDPDGKHCYMATARSLGYDPLHFNNDLIKLPLPSLSPTMYMVHEHCHFIELSSVFYVGTDNFGPLTNGMNGAAASPNWVYLYNSDTLRRYDKNTGSLVSEFPVRTNSAFEFGGLDVDLCDNLFVGVADSVYVLYPTYAIDAKIPLPDTAFDVQLGQNGALYACGIGYVTQLTNPIAPHLISSAFGTPSSCSACNGTATVNTDCGVTPFMFQWSDGNTNQTDTGLCAGTYTVTVTDAACPPRIETAIVNIPGELGYSATISDTNPDCALRKGDVTVHPAGGHPPYTYMWSNGSTNQRDTGLLAGPYTCIITDDSGCKYEIGVILANPAPPRVTVVPDLDSLCTGTNVSLVASGANTYKWSPSLGLSCNNCPNPIASPSVTTIYTVIGTNNDGCADTTTSTLKVYLMPNPVIRGNDSICAGYTDTLTVTGGPKYKWSTGATTTSITYRPIGTQTITVASSNGMCSKDTSFVIHVVSISVKAVASKDSVCLGDSVELKGSGGIVYKWNTGSTSRNIWVNPIITTTYTLYNNTGVCPDSTTIKVNVIPALTASIVVTKDSICPNETTTITATTTRGAAGYKWSTGATTSSIKVTDTVTTTYMATVYGTCDDSVQKKVTVIVIPLPKPVTSGISSKCQGEKDTLTVSSSTNPTTYLWSNGKTTTTIITGDINADSIIYVTAYNSLGCPVKDTFKIMEKPNPSGNISYPPGCGNGETTITATASGTGPFTYKWNTGGTYDTINVIIRDTAMYTVVISNGCSVTKTVEVFQDVPLLSACCNTIVLAGDDTLISAGGPSIIKYQWEPDDGSLNCDTCANVIASPTVTTTYTVIGTDAEGCLNERIVTIIVESPCFNLIVPNVFTPTNNGALGVDNMFYIKAENMDAWSLTIYNRWGIEMFHTNNTYQYWNGNTENGGQAPAGVYYYIINATCNNRTYRKDGFVQLIR